MLIELHQYPPALTQSASVFAVYTSWAKAGTVKASASAMANIVIRVFITFSPLRWTKPRSLNAFLLHRVPGTPDPIAGLVRRASLRRSLGAASASHQVWQSPAPFPGRLGSGFLIEKPRTLHEPGLPRTAVRLHDGGTSGYTAHRTLLRNQHAIRALVAHKVKGRRPEADATINLSGVRQAADLPESPLAAAAALPCGRSCWLRGWCTRVLRQVWQAKECASTIARYCACQLVCVCRSLIAALRWSVVSSF